MKYQNGQPLLGLAPAGVLDRHSQPNFQTSGYSTDEKSNPWVRRDVSPAFDVHRLGAFSQLAKHGSQQDDQKRLTPGAARATAKALATSA